jgi:hypothetical protein
VPFIPLQGDNGHVIRGPLPGYIKVPSFSH